VFYFEDSPVVMIPYRSELFKNAHHTWGKPRDKRLFSPFLEDFTIGIKNCDLRLALPNGPYSVGASHPFTEDRNRSSFQNVFFRILDDGRSPKAQ
jgi:hypothetical protein